MSEAQSSASNSAVEDTECLFDSEGSEDSDGYESKDVFLEAEDFIIWDRTSPQPNSDPEQTWRTSAKRKRPEMRNGAFKSTPSKKDLQQQIVQDVSPEVENTNPPLLTLKFCEEDCKPTPSSLQPPLTFLAVKDVKPSIPELMSSVEHAKLSTLASMSDEEDATPSPLDLLQITVHGQQRGAGRAESPVNFWTLLEREDTSGHSDEEPESPASKISISDSDEWEPEKKSRRKQSPESASDGDCDLQQKEKGPAIKRSSQNLLRTQSPPKAKQSSVGDCPTASKGKRSIADPSKKKRSSHSIPSEALQWCTLEEKDIEPSPLPFMPIRQPGPQHSTRHAESPMDFFRLYFSDGVIKTLLVNTNAYGSQNTLPRDKWADFTFENMFSFFSIVIFMGLLKLPQLGDYWKTSRLYNIPFPPSVMSKAKFLNICRSLHMCSLKEDAENQEVKGTSAHDRLCKLKPLYLQILNACKMHFHPDQNLCINEQIVIPNGGILAKEHIRHKYTMGYKLFVLTDSATGYKWNFFISEGVKSTLQNCSGKGLAYDTVMSLIDLEHLGTGYHLYVDHFYTSPPLFRELLAKNIGACGSFSQNEINLLKTNFPLNAPRGSIRWIRNGELLFVKWKDTQEVVLCSTIHKAYGGETVHRRLKKGGKYVHVNLPIPPALTAYNQHTGGDGPSDGLIFYSNVLLKTKKWYRTLFYHLVDIAVANAHILYNHCHKDKSMTQREFREVLVQQLADRGSGAAPPQRSANTHKATFLSKGKRFPREMAATLGRRRCALCHRKTPVGCETCDVPLCFVPLRNCYGQWHLKYNL